MGKEWVVRVRPLTDPAIEPFGRAVRRESGTPPNQSGAGWAIFVMRADGANPRLLIPRVPTDGALWARESLGTGP